MRFLGKLEENYESMTSKSYTNLLWLGKFIIYCVVIIRVAISLFQLLHIDTIQAVALRGGPMRWQLMRFGPSHCAICVGLIAPKRYYVMCIFLIFFGKWFLGNKTFVMHFFWILLSCILILLEEEKT